MFGYKIEQNIDSTTSWADYIHPDDRENVVKSFHEIIDNAKQDIWLAEYRYLKADGTYAFVVDRGVAIRNEKGKAIRIVGAMSDITYRKEYEESLKKLNAELKKHAKELEISNAELEQFAYVASHDLQEPLRMVTSFLTQLEKKYKDQLDEKAHKYIHFAVDGAKRMRQIILDLLEYSRVGRFEEDMELVDLNKLIEDYKKLRYRLIDEKSAKIIYDTLPQITAHKAPITQIFHNLIDNALKYTKPDENPEIVIKAKEKDTYWKFSIQDNGIGIEDKYFDKIFVIFQRLHDKSEYGGTGMGLTIVKKIIENYNGKIWVESNVNNGSTFYFTINK